MPYSYVVLHITEQSATHISYEHWGQDGNAHALFSECMHGVCKVYIIYNFFFQQAYHFGKVYPNYAWLLLGHYETDWWREHYIETNCSETDMMKALNRSLVFIPYPDIGDFKNLTEVKKMVKWFFCLYTFGTL